MKVEKAAFVTRCGQFRYWLTRNWSNAGPVLVFIMLNPSTANAKIDDATIRKCMGFAKRFGFGGIAVVNLFAYRTRWPSELIGAQYPVGELNDHHIKRIVGNALFNGGKVICAWGPSASRTNRPEEVMELLSGVKLYCLSKTKDGSPGHPLMLSYERPMLEYKLEERHESISAQESI
jgi:hypothetical protein